MFGCGRLRAKGPNSSVWTYAVDSLRNLEDSVLPFFEDHRLVVKADDFRSFALRLTLPRNLPAPGRRQCVYIVLRLRTHLCF